MPPDTAEQVLQLVADARHALDSLLVSRKRAERERGLDAMPLQEIDLWVTDIEAALIAAQQAARPWETTAADIRRDTQ